MDILTVGVNLNQLFNLFGLIINITGAFLMYINTPKPTSSTVLYSREEMKKVKEKDASKNRWVRTGMLFLGIGFILQAIALFI